MNKKEITNALLCGIAYGAIFMAGLLMSLYVLIELN